MTEHREYREKKPRWQCDGCRQSFEERLEWLQHIERFLNFIHSGEVHAMSLYAKVILLMLLGIVLLGVVAFAVAYFLIWGW